MKIQSLAVIFVIIILPISIIISEFLQTQIATVSMQALYDSSLVSSTYDAVKAYQLNSFNSSSSDIANSRIRNIEASANTFLNSIKNSFKLSGNSSKVINDYLPAIVYTMYDGYYIYSPYNNEISGIYSEENPTWATYKNGERIDGIKPYVYYSCRYKGSGCDVVITYSLDNYITIQGQVGTEYWNKAGYYLNKVEEKPDGYYYNETKILSEESLRENIYDPDVYDSERGVQGKVMNYKYATIDGTKYYIDNNDNNDNVFYIQNGDKTYNPSTQAKKSQIENNTSAYEFYKNAYKFTQEIKNNGYISGLSFSDAKDEEGNAISENGFKEADKIFGGSKDAEEEGSNFNVHRTAVIRRSIEKNLTVAIANYDAKFGGDAAFSMPNLSEEDWYKLINETAIITFLQGFPMGMKTYNGYAVVTNNKNNDVVTDYSIYMSDGTEYHRIDENGLVNKVNLTGYLNVDFEKRTLDETHYFYPRQETASYISIVNQTGVNQIDNLYEYLKSNSLATAYYTALGRERYGMKRIGTQLTKYP